MLGEAVGTRFCRSTALCGWIWALCSAFFLLASASGQASPKLRAASAVAYDRAGNLYIADAAGNQVLEATLGGQLVLIAGIGVQGYAGDGGPATAAQLNEPQGLAFGADGTLYIADTGNQRVRAVTPAGVISTFVGDGVAGDRGDGGSPGAAGLRDPTALAVDSGGGLLICDAGNRRVRRVVAGVITTVAGTGVQGNSGDGGPATSAQLDTPSGLTASADGRIFVADKHQHRVRVIGSDGTVQAFAGTGSAGFSGDGEQATKAQLSGPQGLMWTPSGTLLIADTGNQRVRQISAAGVISTVAGSGVEGVSVDGSTSMAAMRSPRSVAVSSFGLPVVADTLNGVVRELSGGTVLYQPAALVSGRTSTVKVQGAGSQVYGTGALAISVAGQAGVPQGQVVMTEGGVPEATGTISGGVAAVDLSGLDAGSHQLTVNYVGDGLNPAASGTSFALAVSALAVTATATSASVAYGAPLPALSGTLSGVLPGDVGQVSAVFGTSAGTASAAGMYPVTVSLIGPKAGNYTVSLSPASGGLQITRASSEASLGKIGAGYAGMPLTVVATVASSTSGVPTGSVQLLEGSTVVATGTLAGGAATISYPAPPLGTHALAVQYLGDPNFLPSTSGLSMANVSAMPDFVLASTGSQSASTAIGGTATFTISVSAQPGPFTGAVALSAAGLPPGASISFSPPQVVPGTGSAMVTVAVQTAAALSRRAEPVGGGGAGTRVASVVGAAALLGMALRRRRRKTGLPWLLAAVISLSGCGARTVGEGNAGVLAQTYTLQVEGTATNLAGAVVTHTMPLTLTIQN